jgi:hypothetical protein
MAKEDLIAEMAAAEKPLRITAHGCLSERLLGVGDLNELIVDIAKRRLVEEGKSVDPWAGSLVVGVGDSDVGVTYEVHVVVHPQDHEVVLVDVPWDEMSLYSGWHEVLGEAEGIGRES